MLGLPARQSGTGLGFAVFPATLGRQPGLVFTAQRCLDDPVVGLHPILDGKGGIEERLQGIIVLLGDGLELVVVALGALNGQSQQARPDDLLAGFQRIITIHTDLVRIAVRFTRAVLTVAQEMGRLQQLPNLRSHRIPGFPSRQFVARQLLPYPAIEGFILIDRPDHVVAVTEGQRTIRVGVEVPVGIGIPHRIQPVLGPALSIGRGGQQPLQPNLRGLGSVVGDKGLEIFRSRRQSGEHYCHPTQAGRRIGLRAWGQALRPQVPFNKAVQGAHLGSSRHGLRPSTWHRC